MCNQVYIIQKSKNVFYTSETKQFPRSEVWILRFDILVELILRISAYFLFGNEAAIMEPLNIAFFRWRNSSRNNERKQEDRQALSGEKIAMIATWLDAFKDDRSLSSVWNDMDMSSS